MTSGGEHERWLELSVDVAREYAEPVTHLFWRHGDGKVYVGETGDWDADDIASSASSQSDIVTVTGYLTVDDTLDHRKGMIDIGLRLIGQLTQVGDTSERVVTPDDWSSQPVPVTRIGERFLIVPTGTSDHVAGVRDGDTVISLAPGLAFGTGTHPTTKMCLEQLGREHHAGTLREADILDVGCGSGVLTIAALKLGAHRAWCLDIDETAIRATTMNVKSSAVADRATVLPGSLPHDQLSGRRFDLVTANITANVLIDLADDLTASVADNGALIISGILIDRGTETLAAFKARGMNPVKHVREGDWEMYKLVRVPR